MEPDRKYSLEGILASLIFLVLIGVVTIQILGRTPVMRGPVWTEEAARWLWVWMAFIGIGEVERQNKHLRMGFIAMMLPDVVRRIVFTGVDLAYLGIMGHLCWIGWRTLVRTSANSAVSLPVSDAVLYASAFLASIFVIHRILRRILAGQSGDIEGTRAL